MQSLKAFRILTTWCFASTSRFSGCLRRLASSCRAPSLASLGGSLRSASGPPAAMASRLRHRSLSVQVWITSACRLIASRLRSPHLPLRALLFAGRGPPSADVHLRAAFGQHSGARGRFARPVPSANASRSRPSVGARIRPAAKRPGPHSCTCDKYEAEGRVKFPH